VKSVDITDERSLTPLAKEILNQYKPPYCFALNGDLGAGKTTFVKYLMAEVGIKDLVTSPTYSLVNVYGEGDKKIYHLDLYRLNDWREAINIGIEEILDSKHYVWIEWPKIIDHLLPVTTLQLNIKVITNKRFVEYE